jgi:DTW domain-containing protein YfiP
MTNYLDTSKLFFSKSFSDLENQDGRTRCPNCNNKRKYYCYDCIVAINHEPPVPSHRLPVQVHIVRHKSERRSKSSIIPLKLAYPQDVFLYEFTQPDRFDSSANEGRIVPSFANDFDWEHTALLFPEEGVARTLSEILHPREAEQSTNKTTPPVIRNILVIDSTWSTALQVIKRSGEIRSIKHRIGLGEGNKTIFWRHQKINRRCLATCEAIYVLMREMWDATGTAQYDHRYDDVLYYYVFVHSLINEHYRTTKRHKGHLPEYALVDNS